MRRPRLKMIARGKPPFLWSGRRRPFDLHGQPSTMPPFATSSLLRFLSAAALACLLSACATTTGYERPRGPLMATGPFDTVVLDAGHGGQDPGARAVFGLTEKALALDTSRRVAALLRQSGLRVVETRSRDVFIPLDGRVAISNRLRNAIFVSIHYNWAKRAKAAGIETFYHSPRGSRLAHHLQKQTLKAYGAANRGVKVRGFYVLKNNRRPAVLCELGFLSNKGDNRSVQKPAVRQRLAEAIARAIIAEKNGESP